MPNKRVPLNQHFQSWCVRISIRVHDDDVRVVSPYSEAWTRVVFWNGDEEAIKAAISAGFRGMQERSQDRLGG